MKGIRKPRVSPSMAVALTALVFATTGAGYAATHLPGDTHATVAKKKKKKVKAGPPGPQGPQGPSGATGSAGAGAVFGVVDNVDSTHAVGTVTGVSIAQSSVGLVNLMGTPSVAITIRDLEAKLQGATISGTDTYTVQFVDSSVNLYNTGCVIRSSTAGGDGHTCESTTPVTIPPGSQIGIFFTPSGSPPSGFIGFGYRVGTP
jgi:hypothetical protein